MPIPYCAMSIVIIMALSCCMCSRIYRNEIYPIQITIIVKNNAIIIFMLI